MSGCNRSSYNQGQKGWDEFAFTMFTYARERDTLRANDKWPFPDPTPLTMLSPCKKKGRNSLNIH